MQCAPALSHSSLLRAGELFATIRTSLTRISTMVYAPIDPHRSKQVGRLSGDGTGPAKGPELNPAGETTNDPYRHRRRVRRNHRRRVHRHHPGAAGARAE